MIAKHALHSLLAFALYAALDEKPAFVTGVVRAQQGGGVLAEYSLELRAGGKLEHVTTDAAGNFRSALAYTPGRITLVPFDSEGTHPAPLHGGLELTPAGTGPMEFEWKGAPLALAVATGPTFELTWKPHEESSSPPAPGAARVRLIAVAPDSVDEGITLEARARFGAENRAWARFAALPPQAFAKPNLARLEVVSADGVWKSDAAVEDVTAGKARQLELTWRPAGRIFGALRDEAGNGVGDVWVQLERLGEDDGVVERLRTRCTGAGEFKLVGLELGRWRAVGRPLRHHPFASEIQDLTKNPRGATAISLHYEGTRGVLSGRVVGGAASPDSAPPPAVRIVLQRSEEKLPEDATIPQWGMEAGEWVATFAFPELPIRRYEILLEPTAGDEAAWVTRSAHARPDADPVVFERR